jgi:hypothetical protein
MAGTENDGDRNGTHRDEAVRGGVVLALDHDGAMKALARLLRKQ